MCLPVAVGVLYLKDDVSLCPGECAAVDEVAVGRGAIPLASIFGTTEMQ